jgi:tRNA nucleotidyltransferase (CCA-adding enzyme)
MTDTPTIAIIPHWEHFEHRADMGVRGLGVTPAEAFAQTALALTAVVTEPSLVEPAQRIEVTVEQGDPELLLVDFLNALIYEMATRKMLFGRFEVTIEGGHLAAAAWGETVDRERHQPAVEIKGATYTGLRVARQPDGTWLAQCVVDV